MLYPFFIYEVYIMNNLSKTNMEIYKAIKHLYKGVNSVVVYISNEEKLFIDIKNVIIINEFEIKNGKACIYASEKTKEIEHYTDYKGTIFSVDEYEIAYAISEKFVKNLSPSYKYVQVLHEIDIEKELSLVISDKKYVSNAFTESVGGYNIESYSDIKFCPKQYVYDQLSNYKHISYTETGMNSNKNLGIYLNNQDMNLSTDVIFRVSVNDCIICKNVEELNNAKLAIDKVLEETNSLSDEFKNKTFTFDEIKKYFDEEYYASDDYFSSDAFNDFFNSQTDIEALKQKYYDLLSPESYVY